MKLNNICKRLFFLFAILMIAGCGLPQLDYKYHKLTLNKNLTIEDVRDMKYEVGALLVKQTTKYLDEKGQSDKTYKQFDKKQQITIIGALNENMKEHFYQNVQQTDTDIMKINVLTGIKRYEKQRICQRCRRCGRKCTHCWEEPCMKDHYDVVTNIIGTDKQNKDNILFKYKIKYSRNNEGERYKRIVDDFDEILEFQINQFVKDLNNFSE